LNLLPAIVPEGFVITEVQLKLELGGKIGGVGIQIQGDVGVTLAPKA